MTTRTPLKLSADDYRFDDSIGFLVGKLRAFLMQALDATLADLGITAAQGIILIRLGAEPDCTAASLCRRSGYDTGSMTRMVDRLEDKGLIVRERSTEDRRVIKLLLTESGINLRSQITRRACEMMEPRLEGFSEEEYVLLKSLLRRVLDNAIRLAPNEHVFADPADGGSE
ncbi:MAG: transcriptional regulator, MarR family [Rhodocyclales bacterium]|nr:transcriptional regulator, MarR family [Rhodocyclales bacterium]